MKLNAILESPADKRQMLALQQFLIDGLDENFDVELRRFAVIVTPKFKSTAYPGPIIVQVREAYMLGVPHPKGEFGEICTVEPSGTRKTVIDSEKFFADLNAAAEQSLEEGLKHAIAAGVLAAASLTGSTPKQDHEPVTAAQKAENDSETQRFGAKQHMAHEHNKAEARARGLAQIVTDKYAVGTDFALKVARLAVKHEKPSFPRAEDLLSVIGIESSFKPDAKSALKNDPAVGLTQIRPAVWGIKPEVLKGNIENQVKMGANILHAYYKKLNSEDGALHAFNVGITNYMKKKGLNPRYVQKFDKERGLYEAIDPELQAVLGYQQDIAEHVDHTDLLISSDKKSLLVTGPGGWFKWKVYIKPNKSNKSGAEVDIHRACANEPRLATQGLGELIYTLRSYEELYARLPKKHKVGGDPSPWEIVYSAPDGARFLVSFGTSDDPEDELLYSYELKKANRIIHRAGDIRIAELLKAFKQNLG